MTMLARGIYQHGVNTVLIKRYLEHIRIDDIVRRDIGVVTGVDKHSVHRDLHTGDGGYVAEYRVGLVGETGEPVVVVVGVKGVGTLVMAKAPFDMIAKHLMSIAVRG
ncbi:MAG: hypothetical protein GXO43_05875 [Crenarchaeota archaeon]|nr:hypothetical protein [Thermoproteota archaeon]